MSDPGKPRKRKTGRRRVSFGGTSQSTFAGSSMVTPKPEEADEADKKKRKKRKKDES